MIDSQLRPSGVNDESVLRRMGSLPREDYVPENARGIAYMDRAVPLGQGRYLAAPIVHGMMLQEAEPRADDVALVVGGGSSYLADLVRPLVGSLEILTPAQAAKGEGASGAFSLILIDGAVEQVPDALAALLKADGRAITGLVAHGVTRLAIGRRAGAGLALLPLAELGIPLLPEFARPKAWSF